MENVEIALTVNDIEKYNYEYKYSKEKVSELTLSITKMLSENSSEQAKIETIKNNISKLNSELYLKQQELVKVSANAEKLSGEKAMISERSKYNSEDVKLHDNIISLKEKILKIESQISALNKEIESEKSNNKIIGEKLNNTEIKLCEIEKNKENLNSKLNQKLREITAQKHRREVLMNSLENNSSLPYSVKNVLNNPKLTGIHGVLGKLLEFEEKYSEALEVSLMSSVSHIVCDNEEDAKEAVRYLKNNNLGRATFLPISVIKPRSIDSESYETIKSMNGFVDIASNLVKYDTKYRNIVLSLLGTIIVVDNIDNANLVSKKLKNRYKVVTMTGEVVQYWWFNNRWIT